MNNMYGHGNKLIKMITTIALAAVVVMTALPAKAADRIDTEAPVSLTINAVYGDEKTPVPGMEYKLYRIADLQWNGEYVLKEEISGYDIYVEHTNAESWSAFATTLAPYLERDNVAADHIFKTDETGKIALNTADNDLKQGLYLVIGNPVTIERRTYSTSVFLVSLPQLHSNGMSWVYDVEVNAKLEMNETPEELVSRRALKRWVVPADGSVTVPASIDVQLMRNGLVYDTQTLSAANGWAYQWDELDPTSRWTVVERQVPGGYTVSITAEGVTFLVTNSYTPPDAPPTTPPTTPPETTTPPTPNPETPSVQGAKRVPGPDIQEQTGQVLGASRLPQTGVLFWPIPILFTIGGLLIVMGIMLQRQDNEEGSSFIKR